MRGTWQTTSSGGSGGGGLGVAVVVALVLIGSGAFTAIMHALAVLLIAAAVAIPVTAVSIIALTATRTRSERPGRPDGPAWVSREPPGMRRRLEVPDKPAIGPPRELAASEVNHHLHLHGLTPEQIAAILRHYSGEGEHTEHTRTPGSGVVVPRRRAQAGRLRCHDNSCPFYAVMREFGILHLRYHSP